MGFIVGPPYPLRITLNPTTRPHECRVRIDGYIDRGTKRYLPRSPISTNRLPRFMQNTSCVCACARVCVCADAMCVRVHV